MLHQLGLLFKDRKLLNIFLKIVNSYHVQPTKGLPIGNLTSQYFANHYLTVLDHYIKEILKIPGYVRYMDDLVLWHNNNEYLLKAGRDVQQFSRNKLKIMLKPFCLNRNVKGLPFLGYLLYPGTVRLKHTSKERFIKKMRLYENNLQSDVWTQKDYQNHVIPLVAFTEYAQSKEFRKKVMTRISGIN